MAIARRFHFHLLFHFHTIEQDILRMRIAFLSECFNVEPCGLSDRARRGRLEVLAKMIRRNVRERAKSDLYADDSPRTLLASNRVDLPHQIVDERGFVQSPSFTLRRTSSAAASTSGDRPTPESKVFPSIP